MDAATGHGLGEQKCRLCRTPDISERLARAGSYSLWLVKVHSANQAPTRSKGPPSIVTRAAILLIYDGSDNGTRNSGQQVADELCLRSVTLMVLRGTEVC